MELNAEALKCRGTSQIGVKLEKKKIIWYINSDFRGKIMALTGLQIYKYLPRTNCKKCGFATCLAFAMALAQKKISLDKCPDLPEEAKKALDEASQPPMATLRWGIKGSEYETGGETVLFRHEKTFYHAPRFVLLLSDSLFPDDFGSRAEKIKALTFERVGQTFKIDAIAIKNDSGNAEKFLRCVERIKDMPLVLISTDPGAVEKASKAVPGQTPVILGKWGSEWIRIAKETGAVLSVPGNSLGEIEKRVEEAHKHGLKNLILYPETASIKESLHIFTQSWRAALKKNNRLLGYPLLGFPGKDPELAAHMLCKYAGIIIMEEMGYTELNALTALRINIYTDPQKPLMMEPALYEVGKPGDTSPVIVTTNFSLTYFTVQPEIENSKVPSWLIITDSEGQSVLTAWAADKFNAEIIAAAIKKAEMENRVKHRKIIIPGYVAILKAKLEEESGWEVIVGPKEASGIPKFLKTFSL